MAICWTDGCVWTEHPHTSHFLVFVRMFNNVARDIGSKVFVRVMSSMCHALVCLASLRLSTLHSSQSLSSSASSSWSSPSSSVWIGSEKNPLCASANEESDPLVNNAPSHRNWRPAQPHEISSGRHRAWWQTKPNALELISEFKENQISRLTTKKATNSWVSEQGQSHGSILSKSRRDGEPRDFSVPRALLQEQGTVEANETLMVIEHSTVQVVLQLQLQGTHKLQTWTWKSWS